MIDSIDKTHDYVNELEMENKVLEEYISNQQKKIDGLKELLGKVLNLMEHEVDFPDSYWKKSIELKKEIRGAVK